jgi:hypothetical protein
MQLLSDLYLIREILFILSKDSLCTQRLCGEDLRLWTSL